MHKWKPCVTFQKVIIPFSLVMVIISIWLFNYAITNNQEIFAASGLLITMLIIFIGNLYSFYYTRYKDGLNEIILDNNSILIISIIIS